MSSELFESVKASLEEAIAWAKGEPVDVIIHYIPSPDVKAIRKKTGMSQQAFADAFGFSVAALRHWERGDRTPQGPARSLLQIIDKIPQAAMRALEESNEEIRRGIVTERPNAPADAQAPANAAKTAKATKNRPRPRKAQVEAQS